LKAFLIGDGIKRNNEAGFLGGLPSQEDLMCFNGVCKLYSINDPF